MFGAMGIKMGAEMLSKMMEKMQSQGAGGAGEDDGAQDPQKKFAEMLKSMMG
jgi:hypothetical protein